MKRLKELKWEKLTPILLAPLDILVVSIEWSTLSLLRMFLSLSICVSFFPALIVCLVYFQGLPSARHSASSGVLPDLLPPHTPPQSRSALTPQRPQDKTTSDEVRNLILLTSTPSIRSLPTLSDLLFSVVSTSCLWRQNARQYKHIFCFEWIDVMLAFILGGFLC